MLTSPMKKNISKIVFILVLFLFVKNGFSQTPPSVPPATICPGQTTTLCVTWNNVANQTFQLYTLPVVGTGTAVPPGTSCFTVTHPGPGPVSVNYQLVCSGIFSGAPVTQTAYFTVDVIPPPPLTILTDTYYCHNSTITFTAPLGGSLYTIAGPCNNAQYPSNIMTFANPAQSPGCNGQYTVSTVIGGCPQKGVATISVAPVAVIAVNAPSNVCQYAGASVDLTASMPGGKDYQWEDQFANPIGFNQASVNITPLTPANSGVYKVTANQYWPNANTGPLTCPYSATTSINVVAVNPVNASASPNGTLCQGANLTFNANAGSNVSSWQWNGPGSFFSTTQNPLISPVTPINSGPYTVTAYFLSGITCTSQTVVNVNIVAVHQPVIAMPGSVCADPLGIVTMSATAGAPTSWNWQGPFGQGATNLNTSSASFSAPSPSNSGTYYVTATFGTAPFQCSRTSSAQLNVVPVNTISVIPPGQVCEPDDALLQANAIGANSFIWHGPNGFATPGANVIVYNPNQAANGIYTVTAFFGGGNITCPNTNTVQLTVNPVMNFTLVPREQVCYNTPVTIIGPTGATGYTWTSSTGFTSNEKDAQLGVVQPKHAGSYTLMVSLGPCVSGDDTELEVLDPISYTLTPFNQTICSGDTIVLEGGVTGGSENYAYVWNPPIYLDGPVGPRRVAVPLGSMVYNLVTHDIACPHYTISHSFSVNVNHAPTPSLNLTADSGCSPLWLNLNSGTQEEAAITTYDFGGLMQIQRDNFMFALTEPGEYTLKVYSKGKNGCLGTYEHPYPITVYPSPGTDIIWEPERPNTTDEVIFRPTHKYDQVTGYSWTFQGGMNPSDTSAINTLTAISVDTLANQIRYYPSSGKYPVMLITNNYYGCSDTIVKFIDVIDELNIFIPNTFTPNDDGHNDYFFVKGQGVKTEHFLLQVFDRSGTEIFSTNDPQGQWDGTFKGVKVADGTYIYKLRVVGMNGEGKKELTGYVNVLK